MNLPKNAVTDLVQKAIPNQRGMKLPELFSQAGTIMMMSYFAMKLYNLLQDKDSAIADLESKGIPRERGEIVYMALVAAMAAGIIFIVVARRASYKAQIGLAFLTFVSLSEAMVSSQEEMFKYLSIAGGLMIAMD